jgi:hypothetical protein
MSETNNERHNIIREAMKKHRLAIRCTIVGGSSQRATVFRGEADKPVDEIYLVNGKPITADGETAQSAVAACEDALMAHLSVTTAPLSGDDEMRAQMAAMAAEIAALKAANAPAQPPPPKPPKAGKSDPA